VELTVGDVRITAEQGDLTAVTADAIVNAANEYLAHGGGLAAAIVRAGGEQIQEESDRWVAERGPLAPGRAAVTGAGRLPSRHVIHVAGPIFRDSADNEGLLRAAVAAALDAAAELGVRSVALPAISAGIFGYPLDEATRVIAGRAVDWASDHRGSVDTIRLVGFDDRTAAAFAEGLRRSG
jgi:putative ATPase